MDRIIIRTKNLFLHYKKSFSISWNASHLLFLFRSIYEIISVGIPIVSLFLTKRIINILGSSEYQNRKTEFVILIAITLAIQLANGLLGKLNTYLSSIHSDIIGHSIDKEIIEQVNKLDISFFDNPEFYDNMQNAIRDSGSLQALTGVSFTMVKSVIQLISHLIIMIDLNPLIPLIIAISCLPSIFADKYIAKKRYEWQIQRARNDRKLGYFKAILESKMSAKDIRVFGIQDYFKSRFNDMWRIWLEEKNKIEKLRLSLSFFASILPICSTILVLVFVGIKIIDGVSSIGDYTLYSGAASQLLASITAFSGVINQSYESEMRLNKYADFLKLKPLLDYSGKKDLKHIQSIEFKNVSFTYPNTKKMILNNISFRIESGRSLALVGLNGAGKSTITKLILRLYDPDEGEVLVNGINLKNYDLAQYYRCVSTVFQDFSRYSLSIRETIALTDLQKINDDKEIVKACKSAELNIGIESLPDGVDTYLGKVFDKNGLELSGGNWQKIAIAQAFFKDSSLILFDEPNSALDPEAERNVFEKMVHLRKNKCVLYVTHRLSAATTASQILVIENGLCIESGNHRELMKRRGKYYDLFTKQAERYLEERCNQGK